MKNTTPSDRVRRARNANERLKQLGGVSVRSSELVVLRAGLAKLAIELDARAAGKTVEQDALHTYRDMRFNAEVLRMAEKIIGIEAQHNNS